jgi:hypothetical protein
MTWREKAMKRTMNDVVLPVIGRLFIRESEFRSRWAEG